jgi:hypothetical protein
LPAFQAFCFCFCYSILSSALRPHIFFLVTYLTLLDLYYIFLVSPPSLPRVYRVYAGLGEQCHSHVSRLPTPEVDILDVSWPLEQESWCLNCINSHWTTFLASNVYDKSCSPRPLNYGDPRLISPTLCIRRPLSLCVDAFLG